MGLRKAAQAVILLLALSPMPALATICGMYGAPAMIGDLFEAGFEPVVISGIPVSIVNWGEARVTDQAPPSPYMQTYAVTYRLLGVRTGDGGLTTPALVDVTVDVTCESGYCGHAPRRFQLRTFILWEGEDGLIGYGGLCGGSIRPLSTPLQSAATLRCFATRDCD
ncbi:MULTISPECIES: hypothetical protein [Roseobacteraceae]|uniref:Lipoprotein n=2 Tax=Roseobacteraceae TaxID=2854170 RepID=A0A239KWA6_9RHOB|nr:MULTISPECIES: hypothetical protein [Roseobacteraceae]SLN75237.1 hypothetical protein ROA7023_03922 [Roseisalinus antarcticus]SNS72756.1 hypothetical protein SAMN04488078_10295 [Antarctobacter heliothermus]SNT21799.1 hypothetical protein SAMN04488078_10722 [Antarctobacter heliothermus]